MSATNDGHHPEEASILNATITALTSAQIAADKSNPIGIAASVASNPSLSSQQCALTPGPEEDLDDRPALAPILMVSYLNSCIGKAKTSLQHRGVPVSTVDSKGMPVEFSYRPIDRNYMDSPSADSSPPVLEAAAVPAGRAAPSLTPP